jgi:hypothetical protein
VAAEPTLWAVGRVWVDDAVTAAPPGAENAVQAAAPAAARTMATAAAIRRTVVERRVRPVFVGSVFMRSLLFVTTEVVW